MGGNPLTDARDVTGGRGPWVWAGPSPQRRAGPSRTPSNSWSGLRVGGGGWSSAVFGKMAPPVTDRGLKSIVWQSECGGTGAERGKARRPRRRALLSCPRPAVSWGAATGTRCFGSHVHVSTSSFFPSQPSFWQHQRWAGCGRTRPSRRRPAPSGLARPGSGPETPPCVSGPGPGFSARGPCAVPRLRCLRGPTSRRCLSTRDSLSAVFLYPAPPLLPTLEFSKTAYSAYSS